MIFSSDFCKSFFEMWSGVGFLCSSFRTLHVKQLAVCPMFTPQHSEMELHYTTDPHNALTIYSLFTLEMLMYVFELITPNRLAFGLSNI